MNRKIVASILIIILLLLQILRYNLWIIDMSTDISMFDLLGGICWILVTILLILSQKSRFLVSMYILLGCGGLNATYNEITLTATNYDINNYIFLVLTIVIILGYNIFLSDISKKK